MVFKVKPIGESVQRFLSVIYGPPGSGKTYGASTLDGKTLIINFDRGTSAIPHDANVDVYTPNDYTELIADINDIANSDYDNIVLDTITVLQNMLVMDYTPPISQKDWGVIGGKINKVINRLDRISSSGKNVIIIAQEKILDEDNPQKMKSTVDLLPSVRSQLTPAARVIGRTHVKDDGTFAISLGSHPRRITKVSIYGVDTTDVNSFKELIDRIHKKDK